MTNEKMEALARKRGISVEELRELAKAAFASMGGASGTGRCKKRSPEHYRKMVEARNKQREERKKAKLATA